MFDSVPVVFLWTPNSEDLCSSSIAKYFSDAGRNVKQCRNKFSIKQEYGLKFPQLADGIDEDRLKEISEYVGMVMLGCNIENNDLSSYCLPHDCIDVGKGKIIHCKGFITQDFVSRVINEARRILDDNPVFPYIALSIIFNHCADKESSFVIVSRDKLYLT